MPNRLADEHSLYLRQHADNPVDWYPWGDEALQKAQQEDKPVLVSIGYSSCHWCHVMAHESFEDEYIARLMNTHFVCIKVDREERPEVDQIYMDAVQMLNGQGGWPLNVFCLPDGRPFAGGTYFPPNEKAGHNLIPWPQLLIRVSDFYSRQKKDLEVNAEAIIGNLKASNTPHKMTGDPVSKGDLIAAVDNLIQNQDREFGGFGRAPKFPPSMTLDFLMSMRGSSTVEETFPKKAEELDSLINRTLTGMAHGGIYDQIGGGFARYSVDQHWMIPHFEKMLYDNALLIDIYSKAYQRYPKELYRKVVDETIGWLSREMAAPNGAFFASLDADTDGEEGATYLWSASEIEGILGESEGRLFCETYNITKEGNFENTGLNNPALLSGDPAIRDKLRGARDKLLEVRNRRPQPGRDEKCLVSWNALLIRGMARAGFIFGRMEWLEDAIAIAGWIWETMRDETNRLASVGYGEQQSGQGTLNDYAYTAEAFMVLSSVIDWIEPGAAATWIDRASLLLDIVEKDFGDESGLGYFFTPATETQLIHRKKDWYDNATPAGNSALIHANGMLHAVTGNHRSMEIAGEMATAYPGILHTSPAAASHALTAIVDRAVGYAVLKVQPGTDMEPVRKAIVTKPWRPVILMVAKPDELNENYQLCVGTQCLAPTSDLQDLMDRI